MTPPVKLRATAPINVSTGALLDDGDPYEPEVKDGVLHPEDQAHVDEGRLVPLDDREVGDDGQIVEDGEPEAKALPAAKPAARGKKEA